MTADKANTLTVTVQEITMRDYFAAQALNGAIATLGEDYELADGLTAERFYFEVSESMYKWADAMIAAREVQP